MKLTEDQIYELNNIVERVGYNGGIKVKRSLFHRSGPILVDYKNKNDFVKKVTISSTGHTAERY